MGLLGGGPAGSSSGGKQQGEGRGGAAGGAEGSQEGAADASGGAVADRTAAAAGEGGAAAATATARVVVSIGGHPPVSGPLLAACRVMLSEVRGPGPGGRRRACLLRPAAAALPCGSAADAPRFTAGWHRGP
jgi:hypothetical protein